MDKTFKQAVADGDVEFEPGYLAYRADWFDKHSLPDGESAMPLWQFFGYDSEEELSDAMSEAKLYYVSAPMKVTEGIDPEVRKAGENLWYLAQAAHMGDTRYTRNGYGSDRQVIHRVVYGGSDLEILKDYVEAFEYALEQLPDVRKEIVSIVKGKENPDPLHAMIFPEMKNKPKYQQILFSLHGLKSAYRASLNNSRSVPDGFSANTGDIYFWEEQGEYVQMFPDTMGQMVAQFILAEPENPYAQRMAAELNRISKDYADRVKQWKSAPCVQNRQPVGAKKRSQMIAKSLWQKGLDKASGKPKKGRRPARNIVRPVG